MKNEKESKCPGDTWVPTVPIRKTVIIAVESALLSIGITIDHKTERTINKVRFKDHEFFWVLGEGLLIKSKSRYFLVPSYCVQSVVFMPSEFDFYIR